MLTLLDGRPLTDKGLGFIGTAEVVHLGSNTDKAKQTEAGRPRGRTTPSPESQATSKKQGNQVNETWQKMTARADAPTQAFLLSQSPYRLAVLELGTRCVEDSRRAAGFWRKPRAPADSSTPCAARRCPTETSKSGWLLEVQLSDCYARPFGHAIWNRPLYCRRTSDFFRRNKQPDRQSSAGKTCAHAAHNGELARDLRAH